MIKIEKNGLPDLSQMTVDELDIAIQGDGGKLHEAFDPANLTTETHSMMSAAIISELWRRAEQLERMNHNTYVFIVETDPTSSDQDFFTIRAASQHDAEQLAFEQYFAERDMEMGEDDTLAKYSESGMWSVVHCFEIKGTSITCEWIGGRS